MSLFDAIAILFVVGIAYGISLALYRLYAHPLSRYPGPKLAAATQWYEFYFDVLKRGRFAWEIKRMHEVYGPVVRINPHELHVSEPDFYDELYAGPGKKRNKYDWATNLMMVKGSMWTTIDSDLHKLRRAPLAPYFSSSAIRKFDPVIRNKLDILCDKLENCRRNQEVVCLDVAFTALTTDIITQYAFGISYGFLEAAEFNPGWLKLLQGASEQSILTKHMPWLVDGLRRIPIAWVVKIKPQVASMMRFNKVSVFYSLL
jgi:cytochrome P450